MQIVTQRNSIIFSGKIKELQQQLSLLQTKYTTVKDMIHHCLK
ncbi:MAG: hypothetical protein ABFC84_07250 [Veillonellales bacterium]